jgi:hypothetical protein
MPDNGSSRSIFISYRRDDAGGEAGRLFDDLTRSFGSDTVFMDVAGIEPGMDFRKAIDDNVAGCGVCLVVIGPHWLDIASQTGGRRLDDPNDFVRLEVASALKRNIAVIPVLVHGATMPPVDRLPEDLTDLAYRNAVELTLARWPSDVALLVNALQHYVHVSPMTAGDTVHATVPVQLPAPNSPPRAQTPSRFKLILGISVVPLLLILAGILYFGFREASPIRATVQAQVSLSFNTTVIFTGPSNAVPKYHPFFRLASADGKTITFRDGTVVGIGPPDANDALRTAGDHAISVDLPHQSYATLFLLGTAVNGPQLDQVFTIHYESGSQQFSQSFSDWNASDQQRYTGERLEIEQTTDDQPPAALYGYQIKLDPSKNLQSLTLPQNGNIVILAVTLVP